MPVTKVVTAHDIESEMVANHHRKDRWQRIRRDRQQPMSLP
jgi:hypothetical protein